MSKDEMQARLNGQIAAVQRKPVSDNPHPVATPLNVQWARGWKEIQ